MSRGVFSAPACGGDWAAQGHGAELRAHEEHARSAAFLEEFG
jgi:hypothetical protein